MVRWVVGSILHGGTIELFLVPASDPRPVNKGCGMCYPIFNDAYKRTLSANRKE